MVVSDLLGPLLSRYLLLDHGVPAKGFSHNLAVYLCILTFFFHYYIFGHGESISNSFRPHEPPAELLCAIRWLRGMPKRCYKRGFPKA